MTKVFLTAAFFFYLLLPNYGSACEMNSKTIRGVAKNFISSIIESRGRMDGGYIIGKPSFSFEGTDVSLDENDAPAVDSVENFKIDFEGIARPGPTGKFLIPVVGLALSTGRKNLVYVCVHWDEKNLDQSKIDIMILETNAYKEKQLNWYRKSVKVDHSIAGIALLPFGFLDQHLFRKLEDKGELDLISKFSENVLAKLDKGANNLLSHFIKVGVSRITITKDEMELRTSIGNQTLGHLKLADLKRQLEPKWWRRAIKGDSIFKPIPNGGLE